METITAMTAAPVGPGGVYTGYDVRSLIPEFVASLDLLPRSRDAYARNVAAYVDWLAETGRTGADRADVRAYADHLLAAGRSASTVSAYLSAIRAFYGWAASKGLVSDVARGVKSPRKAAGFRRDALSVAQARAVLDAAASPRDRAIVSLMLHTGLRTIEVVRADVGDIRNVAGMTVLYVQGKGHVDKDQFVVLSDAVMSDLGAYLRSRSEAFATSPLFVSTSPRNKGGRLTTRTIENVVNAAFDAAGIVSDRITAHSLRHTAVTLALLGGATVQDAQAMARHVSVETTMIYAHNIDRMTNPAEARIDAILGGLRCPPDGLGGTARRPSRSGRKSLPPSTPT